jgi:hypothetical protein
MWQRWLAPPAVRERKRLLRAQPRARGETDLEIGCLVPLGAMLVLADRRRRSGRPQCTDVRTGAAAAGGSACDRRRRLSGPQGRRHRSGADALIGPFCAFHKGAR